MRNEVIRVRDMAVLSLALCISLPFLASSTDELSNSTIGGDYSEPAFAFTTHKIRGSTASCEYNLASCEL